MQIFFSGLEIGANNLLSLPNVSHLPAPVSGSKSATDFDIFWEKLYFFPKNRDFSTTFPELLVHIVETKLHILNKIDLWKWNIWR